MNTYKMSITTCCCHQTPGLVVFFFWSCHTHTLQTHRSNVATMSKIELFAVFCASVSFGEVPVTSTPLSLCLFFVPSTRLSGGRERGQGKELRMYKLINENRGQSHCVVLDCKCARALRVSNDFQGSLLIALFLIMKF